MPHPVVAAILWVPFSQPDCPIDGCGIRPVIRVAEGRVRIAGACSHFLRPELFDGHPMLAYAEEPVEKD